MKLYVGNLQELTLENDLKLLFSKYTSFTSVKLVTDKDNGKSRGFAFVEFKSRADGESAMKDFDGFNLKGAALIVSEANLKNNRPIRPSGLF